MNYKNDLIELCKDDKWINKLNKQKLFSAKLKKYHEWKLNHHTWMIKTWSSY